MESSQQLLAVYFPESDSKGAPSRTAGTGTRGPCSLTKEEKLEVNLTAVMPKNNIGTTVSPNPTVYLYVPKTSKQNAEFVVYDKSDRTGKPIYTSNISLPESSGIVKVSLPKTVELQPNNTYIWHFGIICDPNKPSLNYYLNGWLKRTSLTPKIEAKLKELEEKPLEQAKLYAESSVWNETITTLEKSRVTYPNAWKELLQSVGLEKIADSQIFDLSEQI
ncbi:MAG: DUF928 domain-containing protein [Okeania sp. SIO3I5]|uniref:DUF928 domain-containing protein n=1 Tax=Okeania sp. SIO3I5 TaxID=2607805 RepID=UPI0013BE3422|nr:DUF928 domain-containing protein [Okeania sp. SIO3I5]NEQ39704.1 DUF928 domain-containing protein [Okeania sp. SIO3I5]